MLLELWRCGLPWGSRRVAPGVFLVQSLELYREPLPGQDLRYLGRQVDPDCTAGIGSSLALPHTRMETPQSLKWGNTFPPIENKIHLIDSL